MGRKNKRLLLSRYLDLWKEERDILRNCSSGSNRNLYITSAYFAQNGDLEKERKILRIDIRKNPRQAGVFTETDVLITEQLSLQREPESMT